MSLDGYSDRCLQRTADEESRRYDRDRQNTQSVHRFRNSTNVFAVRHRRTHKKPIVQALNVGGWNSGLGSGWNGSCRPAWPLLSIPFVYLGENSGTGRKPYTISHFKKKKSRAFQERTLWFFCEQPSSTLSSTTECVRIRFPSHELHDNVSVRVTPVKWVCFVANANRVVF